MTSIAPEESLRELEQDTRQAWTQYSERLRDLAGQEYERVETESWEALQDELRRLEERREQLRVSAAGPGPRRG
jgi:hypothetical protein